MADKHSTVIVGIFDLNGIPGQFEADDQGVYFTEWLGPGEFGATQLIARPTHLGPERRDPTRLRRSTDKWPGFTSNAGGPPGDRRRRP